MIIYQLEMIIYQFIISFITGFIFYCITSPEQGKNPERSCIIPIPYTDKAFHLHHWCYMTLLLPFVWHIPILSGFALGSIFQSFVWYTDYFILIVPRYR